MKSFLLSSFLILSLTAVAAGAQDEGGERRLLDPSKVAAEGATAGDFVPQGWKLEGSGAEVTGDLNKDGVPDKVLRLVEDMAIERPDGVLNTRYRALVVLFAKPGGGFTRAAVAPKLLACSVCSGVMGDPEGGNITVEIKNGVLDISQLSGSREVTELTQRFRYEPASRRLALIGEDVNTYDRHEGGGTNTSTNYLTGRRITKKTRPGRKGGDPVLVSNKTTRVSLARTFIENVDYENREW